MMKFTVFIKKAPFFNENGAFFSKNGAFFQKNENSNLYISYSTTWP